MISIKGLRQGLLIIFSGPDNEPWLTRLRELQGKLEANPGFFKGGTVAFDVKNMPLSEDDLRRSLALLDAHDVKLWAVIALDRATQARVRALGLSDTLTAPDIPQAQQTVDSEGVGPTVTDGTDATGGASGTLDKPGLRGKRNTPDKDTPADGSAPAKTPIAAPLAGPTTIADTTSIEGTDGLLVRRRVRSGQVLRHPGHIVVIGDVNPGAQLLAGGDIIVWGKLQGSVHAGALGDDRAVICALDMSPTIVKIADAALGLRLDERRRRKGLAKTEMAQLIDQQITFTPWA